MPREEVAPWARAMFTTFLSDPRTDEAVRRSTMLEREWLPERAWGARSNGRWVATLRTEPRTLTVPGSAGCAREVRVDAVTNVTVAATHRRRGLMARMIDRALRSAHERGDALSVLIAAEWPIYGRFGYAPATHSADYSLDPRRAELLAPADPTRLAGAEPEELWPLLGEVFNRARLLRAGQMDRSSSWWARVLGRDGYEPSPGVPSNWLIQTGSDGRADGYLGWQPAGSFDLERPSGKVEVWDLAAASPEAYRNLWAYLCGLDGVGQVNLQVRAVDEQVRWLLVDGRALRTARLVDLLWLRLLDVRAALEARRYASAGELVLEIDDPDGGFASGRYRLAVAADGTAACAPSRSAPDLRLGQRVLASIYLGGFSLAQLQPTGGVQELTAGSLERAEAMFRTPLAPWNTTWF